MKMTTSYDYRPWLWLSLAVLIGVCIWLLSPILTPFVVSALLAWLGDPLVRRIERSGRSRTTGVVLVFTLMTLAMVLTVLLLIPLLERQITQFMQWLPRFAQWVTTTAVPWIEQRFQVSIAAYVDPTALVALLKSHWQQAGGVAAAVLGEISKSGLAILAGIASALLVPVVTFYFLRDWEAMLGRIHELLPRPLEPTVTRLAQQSDQVLGGFLRGQLSVMLALGTIYAIGLTLAGVNLGPLIGFIAGMISFVPYLGAIVGVGAAIIATLVEHGDIPHLLAVLAVFGVGQLIESFLLTPWLVGDRIGMHPVAVIFAIMAGGQLFGFLGVLLALPVAAVAMVLLRYAHERYVASRLYRADDNDDDQEQSIASESSSEKPIQITDSSINTTSAT